MVKLPLITESGVIVLTNVVFRGRRDAKILKMVLDTGASITTIPNEIALAIGCDPAKSKKRIEMITASGIEYVPIVVVPKIDLLGFRLKNTEVACLNLPPQSAVSGLLGLNILRNFDIALKFRQKLLEISP